MKTKILLIGIFVMSLPMGAQTAADYYLPLCVGNFTKIHTDVTAGWSKRITRYDIKQADSINGKLYFLEKGIEILDDTPNDTSLFRILWLRKDLNGNILIGAYATSDNDNLDSATIVTSPWASFLNEFLTV